MVTCIPPAFGDGDSREMEASLRRLATLDAEVVAPGHGPVLRGPAQIRAHLEWQAGYVAATRAAVERTRQDDREAWIDNALEAAPREMVYGLHLDVSPHRNVERHGATVSKLVDEAARKAPALARRERGDSGDGRPRRGTP